MRITDDEGRVWTFHFRQEPNARGRSFRGHEYHGRTLCNAHLGDCEFAAKEINLLPCQTTPVARAAAKCSLLDNFVRSVGHKLAFARVINELFPGSRREAPASFAVRKSFWQHYFSIVRSR